MRTFTGFEDLPLADINVLARAMSEVFLPAGTVVAQADVALDRVYLILRGHLAIDRSGLLAAARKAEQQAPLPTDADQPPLLLGERSMYGLVSVLAQEPARANAFAHEDTWAYAIDAAVLFELLEEHFTLLLAMLAGLGRGVLAELNLLPRIEEPFACPELVIPVSPAPLGLGERIMLLFQQPLGLGAERIQPVAAMAQLAQELSLPEGAPLWNIGEPSDVLYFIISGTVEADRGDGTPFIVKSGMPVGGLECLAQLPRWFHATAKTPLRVLQLRTHDILDVFEDHTDAALGVTTALASLLERMLYERKLSHVRSTLCGHPRLSKTRSVI